MSIHVEKTHSGQLRRYSGTCDEYVIKSNEAESDVLSHCIADVQECSLTHKKWKEEDKCAGSHFRYSYKFEKLADGKYLYQVIFPSTH